MAAYSDRVSQTPELELDLESEARTKAFLTGQRIPADSAGTSSKGRVPPPVPPRMLDPSSRGQVEDINVDALSISLRSNNPFVDDVLSQQAGGDASALHHAVASPSTGASNPQLSGDLMRFDRDVTGSSRRVRDSRLSVQFQDLNVDRDDLHARQLDSRSSTMLVDLSMDGSLDSGVDRRADSRPLNGTGCSGVEHRAVSQPLRENDVHSDTFDVFNVTDTDRAHGIAGFGQASAVMHNQDVGDFSRRVNVSQPLRVVAPRNGRGVRPGDAVDGLISHRAMDSQPLNRNLGDFDHRAVSQPSRDRECVDLRAVSQPSRESDCVDHRAESRPLTWDRLDFGSQLQREHVRESDAGFYRSPVVRQAVTDVTRDISRRSRFDDLDSCIPRGEYARVSQGAPYRAGPVGFNHGGCRDHDSFWTGGEHPCSSGRPSLPYVDGDRTLAPSFYGQPSFSDRHFSREAGTPLLARGARSAASGSVPGRKIVKPLTYDGSSNIESYLQQYESISDLNGWDDETMALNLFASVKGAALDTLSEVPRAAQRSYRVLRQRLMMRFDTLNNENRSRGALRERKRKRNESFVELAQDISRLMRKANPHGYSEGTAISHFLDACQDIEMAWLIRWRNPSSLSMAVEMATDYEASRMGMSEPIKSLQSHPEIYVVQDEADQAPGCGKCGQKGHSFKDCPQTQCHGCRKFGHIRLYCPEKKKNAKTSQGNGKDLGPGSKSQDQKKKGPD